MGGETSQSVGRHQRHARVHPRVGGETSERWPATGTPSGPSPRGRGNLDRVLQEPLQARSIPAWAGKPGQQLGAQLFQRLGSIPAWAGKPAYSTRGCAAGGVHPRVGGETVPTTRLGKKGIGPSPRGRGNPSPAPMPLECAIARSIPAWAGKPGADARRGALSRSGSIPAWAGKPLRHSDPISRLYVKDRGLLR